MNVYRAYGLTFATERTFQSSLLPAAPDAPIDLVFEITTESPPERDLAPAVGHRMRLGNAPADGPSGGELPVHDGGPGEDRDDGGDREDGRDGDVGHDGNAACLTSVHIPIGIVYRIFRSRIVAHVAGDPADPMVEIHFLSSALSTWLELHGVLALHASAVVIDGGAVAFLASSRGGKTALAAACMQAGHSLLTDDILAIDVALSDQGGPGAIVARPGYPQMRMWPDNAEHFLGASRARGLDVIHPAYPKKRVVVGGDHGFGRFAEAVAPLVAVFLPERQAGDAETVVEAVGAADAVLALLRNTFSAHAVLIPSLQSSRLERLGALVEALPISRLAFPSGYDRLDAVIDRLV